MEPCNGQYGKALISIGKKYNNVVVLDADYSTITGSCIFQKEFPDRFFNIGIAEQNMVSIAEGMALSGLIPFVSAASAFIARQSYDQIFNTCFSGAHVKFVGHSAGCSLSREGVCLQSYEDIVLMRVIPELPVLVPATKEDLLWAMDAAVTYQGSVYLRVPMPNQFSNLESKTPFQIGKADVHVAGKDLTILSIGPILDEAIKASEILNDNGFSVGVVDMRSLNPIDEELLETVTKIGKIITLEEHMTVGGLGGAVAEFISGGHPCELLRLGLNNHFSETAPTYQELWAKFNLNSDAIVSAATKFLS